MCGIAGIFNLNQSAVDKEKLKGMIDIISYRGPDSLGFYCDNNLGFGHARLSIIDLSRNADQPFTSDEGRFCIIYNGEVYNYLELAEDLKKDGFKFKSKSDVEVVLKYYQHLGHTCVKKFNGMWSFAIWDKFERKLFLSRDRFGVKPLYYLFKDGIFVFASEIKAILKAFPDEKIPNYPYIYRFLNTGALDDGPDTFFKNIKSLLPAHSAFVSEKDKLKIFKHWNYSPEVCEKYDYSASPLAFYELLKDSVKLRLRSDVPVGTCLSGGIDSSSIVTIASGLISGQMHTFSSIYKDKDCDESRYIDIINQKNSTREHKIYPEPDNFMDILKEITWHQDEPSAGPGLYSQWHVMKLAKGKVKVLLDGQGGDEIAGGYFHYFDSYISSLKKLRKEFGRLTTAKRILQEYPKIKKLTGMDFQEGLIEILREVALPRFLNNLLRLPKINLKKKAYGIYDPFFIEDVSNDPIERHFPRVFENDLNNTLYWSLTNLSIPALLHYEDRNSMAFSIEARTPFLDYRLVEFCLGLPFEEKIKADRTKVIMRKALKDILPDEVITRRDKLGYPTPFARWIRQDLKEEIKEILYSNSFINRGIFNPEKIKEMLERHLTGNSDESWMLWRIITLELWYRMFID